MVGFESWKRALNVVSGIPAGCGAWTGLCSIGGLPPVAVRTASGNVHKVTVNSRNTMPMNLSDHLKLTVPLVQAPMAEVSTPLLASCVSNAGGLGSIGVGATDAVGARTMIEELRGRTDQVFNVNVFVHDTPKQDPVREASWLDGLAPIFAEFGVAAPTTLKTIYTSFNDDPDMLTMLLETAPPVVSFHFGLPSADVIAALHRRDIVLMATATSVDEAIAIEAAGIDAIVAQGIEAGGHRGVFDPAARDDALGVSVLTRLLVRHGGLPIVSAGGIMDGAGIAAALDLGAIAAQLGTAFIACPESGADEAYRAVFMGPQGYHTTLTSLISGRPARALANRFTALDDRLAGRFPPDYPIAYDAGKALHAAAKADGEHGFGAQWAGQGAPLARAMSATQLVETLRAELEHCRAGL
jgi:nitronate monooxygenase